MLLGPLTPDYASPEQIRGAPITTACDVYALGVMLFELVAGRRPYDAAGKPINEMVDLVLYAPPARPSAAAPGAVPYDLRALRGDLDAIAARAMEKEPEGRYASAGDLAEELQRYLEARPIVARPPSPFYVAGKMVARHRRAFAVAGVLLALLLGTVGEAVRQARAAARERGRAERRFAQTQVLAHAVLFKIHDAIVGIPGTMRARQLIVDEARAYLEDLSADPGAGDDLRIQLGQAYRELGTLEGYPGIANLGDVHGALASYDRGLTLLAPLLARPEPPLGALYEASTLRARLSHTLASLPGRRAEAEQAAQRSLELAQRMAAREPAGDHTLRALADANIMLAYAVPPHRRAGYWRAALDHHNRLLANDPADPDRMVMAALMETNLAGHLEAHLDGEGARPHHRRARALYQDLVASGRSVRHGDDARATMFGNLGVAGVRLGDDLAGARRSLEESLAIRERIADADAANANALPRVATGHVELSGALEALGEERGAFAHARAALEIFARRPPEPKLLRVLAEGQLRVARLARRGRPEEACAALQGAAATFARLETDGSLTPLDLRLREEASSAAARCPLGSP
jgi:hypothetical protein